MGSFTNPSAGLEAETQALGREIFARARGHGSLLLQDSWWEERLLDWCFRDEAFKTQVFRFIDVLPMLRTDAQVARHLRAYFAKADLPIPPPAAWALDLASGHPMASGPIAGVVRQGARRMARRFIAGATPNEVLPQLERLWRRRMAFTLHLLGETTVSEVEAEAYQRRYRTILDALAGPLQQWPADPLLDQGPDKRLPRINLSLKLSSLYSQIDRYDPDGSVRALKERLRPLLRRARELDAFLYLDMEQHDYKDLTLRVFREILQEDEFRPWVGAGIAVQAYLRESEADVRDLVDWAQGRGAPVTVRLVRGAYWDYETVIAGLRHWAPPVFTHKGETDASYEKLTRLLIESYPAVWTALGTHNVRSLAYGIALSRQLGLPEGALELQMLYGMGDELKEAVVQMGQRLRVYVPLGELLPGIGYLVRRLLENTSNHSFLRLSLRDAHDPEELLQSPQATTPADSPPHGGKGQEFTPSREGPMTRDVPALTGYRPEPLTDFGRSEHREAMRRALETVRGQLGRFYPLVMGGQTVESPMERVSVNPARPSETVGRVARAGVAEADRAVAAAAAAFPSWRDTPVEDRAHCLLRAAQVIRRRKLELAAWQVFEVGKTWPEADADVAEAIDYLEYYAREMLALHAPLRLGDEPGERNEYFYQPRGVAAVIAPWNFPLAILAGMSSAAVVAGNTVVMKPAEQSPVIAAKLMEVFQEAELPPGVVNYLPGLGSEVGEHLVTHPDVALIAFTGSKEVGTRIYALASQLRPGQRQLKRVIAEMGGKNAIVVDDDADLDDAVLGVAASAFGYQGQKCSACSRVIVLEPVYDEFLGRLVEAARSLRVGPPEDPGVTVGPLIDEDAYRKVRGYVDLGREEARLVLEGDVSHLDDGYFVGPTVLADVPPSARIAQEEIFGPVLAVMRAGDFDEAIAMATGVEYALTGGVFSRNPEHIERAKRDFRVGNLYINRKITGAVVGRQPFGGFHMSGIGSKAGGPDYLRQFLEPRTVTENTLRRGFAPGALES